MCCELTSLLQHIWLFEYQKNQKKSMVVFFLNFLSLLLLPWSPLPSLNFNPDLCVNLIYDLQSFLASLIHRLMAIHSLLLLPPNVHTSDKNSGPNANKLWGYHWFPYFYLLFPSHNFHCFFISLVSKILPTLFSITFLYFDLSHPVVVLSPPLFSPSYLIPSAWP